MPRERRTTPGDEPWEPKTAARLLALGAKLYEALATTRLYESGREDLIEASRAAVKAWMHLEIPDSQLPARLPQHFPLPCQNLSHRF